MSGKKLGFVDSTLRDGQESLIGGRLRTELVTSILESMDSVGFRAIEAWGGGTFRSSLALLHEDPWERLRILRRKLKRTPIQILLRGRFLVGNRPFSYGFVKRFLTHASKLGVDVARLFDPLNNFESLTKVADLAQKVGLTPQVSLLCSDLQEKVSYYRRVLEKSDLTGVDALGVFDPWGYLSPTNVGALVKLLSTVNGGHVFMHLHNLGGAALPGIAAGWEKGASVVDSCFSAFTCDGSLPSIEALFSAFNSKDVFKGLNLEALSESSNSFVQLRSEYFDRVPAIFHSLSSTEKNLREVISTSSSLMVQRLSGGQPKEVSGIRGEIAKIMRELGLVALAAPISEILVRQATLNLHSKHRYEELTDEFLSLLRGEFGAVRLPPGFADLQKNHANHERDKWEGEVDERDQIPFKEKPPNEEELLSFTLFPEEFHGMLEARGRNSAKDRQKIVGAALAVLAEAQAGKQRGERVVSGVKTVIGSSRWGNKVWRDESNLATKRGFIQEPF